MPKEAPVTDQPIDITALLAAPPEDPDLEGLADQADPAADPGPDGDLDMNVDGGA